MLVARKKQEFEHRSRAIRKGERSKGKENLCGDRQAGAMPTCRCQWEGRDPEKQSGSKGGAQSARGGTKLIMGEANERKGVRESGN